MILHFFSYFIRHFLGKCGGFNLVKGSCPICYWEGSKRKHK